MYTLFRRLIIDNHRMNIYTSYMLVARSYFSLLSIEGFERQTRTKQMDYVVRIIDGEMYETQAPQRSYYNVNCEWDIQSSCNDREAVECNFHVMGTIKYILDNDTSHTLILCCRHIMVIPAWPYGESQISKAI